MSPELYDMAKRMAWAYVHHDFWHVSREDQEDLVQEAVIKVWRHSPSERSPKLVRTIARTGVVDAARTMFGRERDGSQTAKRSAIATQVYLDGLPEGGDIVRGSHHDTYPSMLESLLQPMNPRHRGAFRLQCQGYSNQEIAKMTGRTDMAVGHSIYRARRSAQAAIRRAA